MSIISRIIRKNTMFANFANVMLCSSVLLAGWQQLVLVVSNIWQAIRLARAGQSLSSSRQECTESRQECTEPRHRITENPLRRVNSFGWMSSGWIVLSLLTFCRLRPWERRGTPFVRSTYTATQVLLGVPSSCYAPSRVLLRAWSPSQLRRLQCEVAALANVTTQIIILEACSQE